MTAAVDGALYMAGRGFHVMPLHGIEWEAVDVEDEHGNYVSTQVQAVCRCGEEHKFEATGKHPLDGGWQLGTEPVPTARLEAWDGNFGVRLDHVTVMDVDLGKPGSQAAWEQIKPRVPPTLVVRTGNGFHYYFRGQAPEGTPVFRTWGELKFGPGHQVVCPGSEHYSGATYTVLSDKPMAELPAFLTDTATATAAAAARVGVSDVARPSLPPAGERRGSGRNRYLDWRFSQLRNQFDDETLFLTVCGLAAEAEVVLDQKYTPARVLEIARYKWKKQGSNWAETFDLLEATGLGTPGEAGAAGAVAIQDSGLIHLADVQIESVQFLWKPYVAVGMVTILDGDPGVGKSVLTIEGLAAPISVGGDWPDGVPIGPPGDVILISGEDDLKSVIAPRLTVAGGDGNRVHYYPGPKDENGKPRPPSVPDDLLWIEAAVASVSNPRLLIIDPLTAHLNAEISSHNDKDVRRALLGLRDLAERRRLSILVVRHLNKGGGTNAITRGGGSIGFIGAVRSGLLAATDPDEPDNVVLAHYKCNYARKGGSLSYRVVDGAAPDVNGEAVEVGRLEWLGESEHTPRSLLEGAAEDGGGDGAGGGRPPVRRDAAEAWLMEYLRSQAAIGQTVTATDVTSAAEAVGISIKTLNRAKKDLGVQSAQVNRQWVWTWSGGHN